MIAPRPIPIGAGNGSCSALESHSPFKALWKRPESAIQQAEDSSISCGWTAVIIPVYDMVTVRIKYACPILYGPHSQGVPPFPNKRCISLISPSVMLFKSIYSFFLGPCPRFKSCRSFPRPTWEENQKGSASPLASWVAGPLGSCLTGAGTLAAILSLIHCGASK